MSVSRFRIDVSDDVLTDLRTRIRRTRFTSASSAEPWAAGTDPAYLRSLLDYWADGFDWRKGRSLAQPPAAPPGRRGRTADPFRARTSRRRRFGPAADPHPRLAEQFRGDAAARAAADRPGAVRR